MPIGENDLSRILLRVADGDAGAMKELFLRERSSLQRLFLGLGRCVSLAEDMVQGTFLNLWQYRRNYRGRGSASAYVYRVAINQWRRNLSRRMRHEDTWHALLSDWDEGTNGDATAELERRERVERLWSAVDDLPDPQREVFVLHRFHDMSCPQISAATETNLKTVESRLRLALKKLTERLQPQGETR